MQVDDIHPTKDWILCRPGSQAYTTEAGLFVQEERFTPEIRWCEVVAIGPDVREDIHAGDRIYADGQQRRNIDIDGDRLWLVPEKWAFALETDRW